MESSFSCFLYLLILSVACCAELKMEKQLASRIPCSSDIDCFQFSADSLCIGNTVDTAGVCYCQKNFIPQQNNTHYECYRTPTSFNDTCEKDIQCQVVFSNWAVCANSHCACIDGAHFLKDKCYQTIRLGATCSFSQQCLLKNYDIGSCLAGICSCGLRQHPVSSPDGESCETTRELGDVCNKDEECNFNYSRCEGTCTCKPGYTTSVEQRNCLKEAQQLGDYCVEDPQCETVSDNTYCENFQCKCRNHHHEYLSKCYKNIRLNGTCSDNRQCWIRPPMNETILCKEGICSCRIAYTEDGRDCINAGFKYQESCFVIMSCVVVLIWQLIAML